MSVDYALWKTGLSCQYLGGDYRNNAFAKWVKVPSLTSRPMIAPSNRSRGVRAGRIDCRWCRNDGQRDHADL